MEASVAIRKEHDGGGVYYLCPRCSFTSESKYNVASHFRFSHLHPNKITQANNTLYSCSECSFENGDKRQLLNHMHSSHLIRRK